ncbi:MAG: hypothetical protein AXA67_08270 [Methylothermaceae bacteria B42]|nr:MAG: hypothetical protein AXA67_08270 [Methylothermaceae bacteria B42]HHJ38547.1 CRISPR-associated protein Csm5 [Methylothermaceae bacterium]
MSGIPETRKLWITPLSPVHMGTDEDYTPTSYVIDGNALYEFDQRALENLPPAERSQLNAILNGKATPDMLKQVQAFFHRNREWLIPAAANVVKVSTEMAKLYEDRIGKAANVESGGKQVLNALEIERAYYNPTDRWLMLPGSGLKGAMRTALLDAVNQGQRTERGERNRELQQCLFHYTMRELHKDPMRLVHVGDCAWQGPEALNSAEVLFAVNRKKHPVTKNGKEVSSQAEQRNLYQLLECAAPFRFRAFRGVLNISAPGRVENEQGKLPELCFSFGEIATACNRFYRPIFERETELLKKRGFLDTQWRKTVEALLNDNSICKRLENNEAFLLRVGRHSGAESVTLNGVRSIKIIMGKGQKPDWGKEAKTIWLATGDKADKRYLKPFGWLLVEMTEPDQTIPEWPEAEKLMEQYNDAMSQWLAEIRERQSTLAEKARIFRKEHAAREAAAIHEVEEKAHRKKAEEERLAQLSPFERELEKIITANRNNNPGAILFNQLMAGEWEDIGDQRIVAEKIKSLWQEEGRWNPDFSGTNKQKVKQKQRCLKVLEYLE